MSYLIWITVKKILVFIGAVGGGSILSQHTTSLQQQQMLLSLNQCYTQLLQQQHDMADRFSRLERLVVMNNPNASTSQAGEEKLLIIDLVNW